MDIGQGVEQRRDFTHKDLPAVQPVRFPAESGLLLLLPGKRPHHPDAQQVFPGAEQHPVQLLLHAAVQRHAGEQNGEDHRQQHRDGDGEGGSGPEVDGKGHDHGAQHHKGGAQKQAQEHVESVLHLVDVIGHPVDQRRGADGVDLPIREGVDVGKQIAAQRHTHADGGLGREILGGERKGKPDDAQQDEQRAHFPEIGAVALDDAHIDHGATTSGTNSSKVASSILNSGARMVMKGWA